MCSNEDDPGQSDLKSVSVGVSASSNANVQPLGANHQTTKPADTTSRSANPNRRSNKPIMEKRRRARINNCLNELKSILLEAMRKDPARHSKLEKADILELTVAHLKELHRSAKSGGDDAASRYRAGYLHCISEVECYLNQSTTGAAISPRIDGGNDVDTNPQSQLTCRLLTHLADSLVLGSGSLHHANANEKSALTSPKCSSASDSVSASASSSVSAASVMFAINGHESEINYNVESSRSRFNHNKSHTAANARATTPSPTSSCTSTAATFCNGNGSVPMSGDTPIISLLPSRLPTGEIAFILPGFNSASFQEKIATGNGNPAPIMQHTVKEDRNRGKSQSLSPEMPLELMVSSSSSSAAAALASYNYAYRDQHRQFRSSSASPSSTTSSNLSSPLSPAVSFNNQVNVSAHGLGLYQNQQQFTNILPAHHHQQHLHLQQQQRRQFYKQKQPYQLQHHLQSYKYDYENEDAMAMDDDHDHDMDEPLALVKVKREGEKGLVVDLSCWRPW